MFINFSPPVFVFLKGGMTKQMAMFSKGTVLRQHKEPAFSRPIVRFISPQTEALCFERTQPQKPLEELQADDIIEIARAAKIVDERDGKLLYRKLLRAKNRAVAVIADAVDDEPYVSSQIAPLLRLREEATVGLDLCNRVANAEPKNVFILAYKNITDIETRIPSALGAYKIVRLRGGYPAESRSEQLQVGAGRKLIVGVGALIHLYRAATQNKLQSTTFVTVAGNCVANPMNLEVSLGMTITQVLERCGLNNQPTRIVCGGPMTGIAIFNPDNTLVTHATRAVLAIRENKRDAYYNCIGCGRCEKACPQGLNPMYIHRFVENSYFPQLRIFDAHMCIGCGTCSYMCPSKLDVAQSVAVAKQYALEHFILPEEEAEKFEE